MPASHTPPEQPSAHRPPRGTAASQGVSLLLAFVAGGAAVLGVQVVSPKQPSGRAAGARSAESPLSAEALPADAWHATGTRTGNAPSPSSVATEDATTPGGRIVPERSASAAAVEPSVPTADLPTLPQPATIFVGVTEPAPGHFARLPLATNQPVAFVDVKAGDRVQKGWQVFSHWESPERLQAMKNELERVRKQRDIAKTRAVAADAVVTRLEKLAGSVTPQELQDATTKASISRSELEAAEASVQEVENRFTAMDFEFKQAFVTSPIEGVVVAVDVVQGERRQVTESFRGVTVLDPRLLQCRVLVTPDQATALQQLPADSLHVSIRTSGRTWPATVVHIGLLAEKSSGLIPILLEVENADESLRCGIRVDVDFSQPLVLTRSSASP